MASAGSISAGGNFVPPQSAFVSNAAQAGGLSAAMKGLQRTAEDDQEKLHHQESAQLSRLAQQAIDQSQQQQQGKAAENARQSGADADLFDDLTHDPGEDTETKDRNRRMGVGQTQDERALAAGAKTGAAQGNGAPGSHHDEAGVELSEIGRSPEEVLSDVPAHSKAFAQGSVEAQLATPAQVEKLTEIKQIPEEKRIEADTPELQPVGALGPILGDKDTGEISHPSPQTEGRAPTSVAEDYHPDAMKAMEANVAETAMAQQNAGQIEMHIAGQNGSAGWVPKDDIGVGTETKSEPPVARARQELLNSTAALSEYGWDGNFQDMLRNANGNEFGAAHQARSTMHSFLVQDPQLSQIWKECSADPKTDGVKAFCDRSRAYMDESGGKYDARDLDAARKMVNCMEASHNYLLAGEGKDPYAAGGVSAVKTPASPERMEQLEGKLFEQVQGMPASFQSEFKGEMGKLGDKFTPENATVAVGSVSAGVAARQLNGFDTASLYGPPGQSEEETKAAQLRAQAKRNEWLEQGVQGDLTDALVFEQNNWAAQRLQQQPSPELAAYKARSDEYIGLQTVMRQGQGLSSGDPDVFDKSAYAQRQAGKA
ncbi:MAG: hypothetical protein AMXMBFR33_63570 [Candidatus Xenobia bacterium]